MTESECAVRAIIPVFANVFAAAAGHIPEAEKCSASGTADFIWTRPAEESAFAISAAEKSGVSEEAVPEDDVLAAAPVIERRVPAVSFEKPAANETRVLPSLFASSVSDGVHETSESTVTKKQRSAGNALCMQKKLFFLQCLVIGLFILFNQRTKRKRYTKSARKNKAGGETVLE